LHFATIHRNLPIFVVKFPHFFSGGGLLPPFSYCRMKTIMPKWGATIFWPFYPKKNIFWGFLPALIDFLS
jgi:hypothetical protein